MSNITALISDNSAAFGFTWEHGPVSHEPAKDGIKVELAKDAPFVKVTDVIAFEDNFPGVILAALNGQSVKVRCQAITRGMYLDARREGGRKPTEEGMREAIVQGLKGMRSRGGVTVVYRDVAGNNHATALEAQQASIAIMVENGVDVATAKRIVAASAPASETVEA